MLLFATPVMAQEQNRAGLVVVHGDGSVVTQCIAFAEESIRGADLLTLSQLDLAMEASSMGATICRIDGEGCDFPAEACFCQCQGSPCIYWSYWRLDGEEWRYSNIGAGNARVRDGDVDGWRWGLGTVESAEAPPLITFDEICATASMPDSAAAPTSVAETPLTVAPTVLAAASPVATSAPVAAVSNESQPVSAEVTPSPVTALGILLGALVMLPAAALLLVWLRAARKERRP